MNNLEIPNLKSNFLSNFLHVLINKQNLIISVTIYMI